MPVDQPQLLITIAGSSVPGAISLRVESVAYYAASRFQLVFALGATNFTTSGYFAALGTATISIDAIANGSFGNLLTGQIDNIRIDLVRNIAILSGRDLSARLIDTEIFETFNNQTSSQIAYTIAARQKLNANVTTTSTPVGQYYELDHTRTALGLNSRVTTEWNLLAQLAQLEGFLLTVAGSTLNFGAPPPAMPVYLTPQDMMLLDFDIATTIPMATTVKSWNSRNKIVVTQTAGSANGPTIIRPNLDAAQAKLVAAGHLTTLAQHMTVLTATMPGDVTLNPAAQIVLAGTNSILDQSYSVDMIIRNISAHGGFTQTIRAYAAAA